MTSLTQLLLQKTAGRLGVGFGSAFSNNRLDIFRVLVNRSSMEMISESEQFYGYIIGLQVERCPKEKVGTKLYATFEDHGKVTVWQVPDSDLFRILSEHLCAMAHIRAEASGDYGYNKLWIKRENGKWMVDLP